MTKYYQLSFPRSGANWLRHIAFNLLDIPIDSIQDNQTDDYLKCHALPNNNQDRKLVVIARNYKECITRHHITNTIDAIDKIFQAPRTTNAYFYPLEQYDKWKQDKYLVYYEDLMFNPNTELNRFADWLGVSKNKLNVFKLYFKDQQEKSLNKYNKVQGSYTRGKTRIHHSKDFSKDLTDRINALMQLRNEDLFNKYLRGYL